MQTENVAQFPEGLDLVEFDNLEPFGTEDPKNLFTIFVSK